MRNIATDFIRRGRAYSNRRSRPRPPEPVHRPFQRERVNLSPTEKAQITHDLERGMQFSCRSILYSGAHPR